VKSPFIVSGCAVLVAAFSFLLFSESPLLAGDQPPPLSFRADLDGTGTPERVLLKKIGETKDFGTFYQLVVVGGGQSG